MTHVKSTELVLEEQHAEIQVILSIAQDNVRFAAEHTAEAKTARLVIKHLKRLIEDLRQLGIEGSRQTIRLSPQDRVTFGCRRPRA